MTSPSMRVDPAEIPALFDRLRQHYPEREEQTRQGVTWVHVPCPSCGKESTRRNVHFSFSSTGKAKCFSCGYGANLKQLAAKLEILDEPAPAPLPVRKAPEPRRYRWMDELPVYFQRYRAHPWVYEAWEGYRGLSPAVVDRYGLGVGVFPPYSSNCQHLRLTVPMLQDGAPVAFRGRAVTDCGHAKWLTTAMGGRPPLLYNGAILLPEHERSMAANYDVTDSDSAYVRGRVLVVVENPVDCLLFDSAGVSAVATLGVTMWTQERPWTTLLKLARPQKVLILYDHDLAGNGAANAAEYQAMTERWREHQRQTWRKTHDTEWTETQPPTPNGVRLANLLNEAGVPAVCFRWPSSAPEKADPGWLIEKVGQQKISEVLG